MHAGENHAVSPAWRKLVQEWMKSEGIKRNDLAKRLGVTPGAITQLFSTAKTSKLVPLINRMMILRTSLLDEDELELAEEMIKQAREGTIDVEKMMENFYDRLKRRRTMSLEGSG